MNKWITLLLASLALFFLANVSALFLTDVTTSISKNNVIIIPLYGVITIDNAERGLIGSNSVIADEVVAELKDAEKDTNIKAIILEINSPGGSAVASAEIAHTVKSLNKTTYALIRDVGASGAYWVASATDKIIASPLSITGSIGVISSYLDFSDLFDNYGVEYQRLVAGKYKDVGTPFKDLTPEERTILEKKLETVHKAFIDEVVANRRIQQDMDRITTGEFFLGTEALDLGLVDALATKEEALEIIKKDLGLEDMNIIEKKKQQSFLALLAQQVPLSLGRGFAAEVLDRSTEQPAVRIEAR